MTAHASSPSTGNGTAAGDGGPAVPVTTGLAEARQRPGPGRHGRRPGLRPRVPGAAVPMIATVAALTVHVVALWLMFVHRADRHWDRTVYLLGGFEAIVFAAIGALLGTSGQRASGRAAQHQAERAHPKRKLRQGRAAQAPAKAAPDET